MPAAVATPRDRRRYHDDEPISSSLSFLLLLVEVSATIDVFVLASSVEYDCHYHRYYHCCE
jgi:hypothetical protein